LVESDALDGVTMRLAVVGVDGSPSLDGLKLRVLGEVEKAEGFVIIFLRRYG